MPTALRPLISKLVAVFVTALVAYLGEKFGITLTDAETQQLRDFLDIAVYGGVYVMVTLGMDWLLGIKRLVEQKHTGDVVVTPSPKPPTDLPPAA